MAEIKYLDLKGLKALYGVVDGKITSAVSGAKTELLGDAAEDYNTLGKLEDKIQAEEGRAASAETALGVRLGALESGENSVGTQITAAVNGLKNGASAGYDTLKGLEDKIKEEESRATGAETTLGGRLDAVEGKIDVINGTGEGSIHKAASDAVAKVVANAPEDFDTLKEVADWIANDKTGSAQMQSDIAILKSGKDVEGSVANSIDKAVNALDATVGTTTVAEDNHVAVEVVQTDGKLTGLTVNENDIASAATLGTVKSAQEANTALLEGIPTGKKVKDYVDEAVAAAKAAATKVAKAADAAHLTVTAGAPASDGSVTYTIGETDIASAATLTSVKSAQEANTAAISGAINESAQTITLGGKTLQFIAFTEQDIQNAATSAAGE